MMNYFIFQDQELVKQEPLLSASSAVSAQSVDSQNLTERSEMFGKHKKNKKKSILLPSKDTVEAPDKCVMNWNTVVGVR